MVESCEHGSHSRVGVGWSGDFLRVLWCSFLSLLDLVSFDVDVFSIAKGWGGGSAIPQWDDIFNKGNLSLFIYLAGRGNDVFVSIVVFMTGHDLNLEYLL